MKASRQKAVVFRFLRAYGFRNIQNVVKKLQKKGRNKSKYDYIEIMACPHGCLNGGGQIRLDLNDVNNLRLSVQKEYISKLRKIYTEDMQKWKARNTRKTKERGEEMKSVCDLIYERLLECKVGSEKAKELFWTSYTHVGKEGTTGIVKLDW